MFEDKNKDRLESMRQTLEEFAEHMYLVSDGMRNFQKDLGIFARELNMMKSYMEVMLNVLDKKGIISKEDTKDLAINNASEKVKNIQKSIKDYEDTMKIENENMKHLIEKFKSSIGSWFDEDGNPIAKA